MLGFPVDSVDFCCSPRIPSEEFLMSEVRPARVQGLAQPLGEIKKNDQRWFIQRI